MTQAHVSCLCGKIRTIVQLSQDVPVASSICHQTRCRHNLGALCHATLPIKDRPDPSVTERLSVFEPHGCGCRYFCSTCGSHLFQNDAGWQVQSGVITGIHSEQVSVSLERIVGHTYVHETIDAGLSAAITGSKNDTPESQLHAVGSCSHTDPAQFSCSTATNVSSDEDHQRLWASCACGGVEFHLTRPDASSRLCSSPWPDLIAPYHARSADNPEDVKWWIAEGHKWLAGLCACKSCRLGLGSPVQAWAFVSRSNLFKSDGSAFSYDIGTLQVFESSPGATREFCRTCGATVFWHNTERPGVVDVSVGLLRASEGALAKSWLSWWTDRVSFSEEAFDKQLIELLESNLYRIKASSSDS